MFRTLESQTVCVVRLRDMARQTGQVQNVSHREVRIEFDQPFDLAVGEKVKILAGDDETFATFYGSVLAADALDIVFWMQIESVTPGVSRARRVTAPGLTATFSTSDQTIDVSLCDLSESGIRIRTLESLAVGTEAILRMDIALGSIELAVRVVRHSETHGDAREYGVELIGADRLSRARYTHLVDSLIRKSALAA